MNKNKIKISFEEALKDLEEIVEDLNSDDLDLEKAITAYEKGMELKKICETRLKEAKLRIETIKDEKIEINKDD
ncbi:MAG: Exodeoxyribonuclease 7 small subunit [Alphaproteobacteria bacterium MarineAlpha9_Bin4]|nr:exodeoxyribonuclease VII small subunit [Pelagibacterales bacterium]PPR25766.1 MAG: Exodeoxyribonuclease 7 small subunit [Alphaproteobacteria bacterium MarineAlpha9_Bin4]|tara:strand:- start:234 stop:455 length:222 start_codon:yes stop_codon:yes gene_type:complete